MSDQRIDQTAFNEVEPLRETTAVPAQPSVPSPPKKKNRVVFSLLFAIAVLLILLVAALLVQQQQHQSTLEATPTPQPTQAPSVPSALEQQVQALEKTVENSDPARNDVPFPPVNLKLRFEDAQTRRD